MKVCVATVTLKSLKKLQNKTEITQQNMLENERLTTFNTYEIISQTAEKYRLTENDTVQLLLTIGAAALHHGSEYNTDGDLVVYLVGPQAVKSNNPIDTLTHIRVDLANFTTPVVE